MKVFLHNKDIIDVTQADTIVLPVDGSAPDMEGNVARRFLRLVELDSMDDLYAPPPSFPFNGRCHWSDIEGEFPETHFHYICALGILSHLPDVDHRAMMRSALYQMFEEAENGRMGTRFACPVLSAGWRLKAIDALYIMLAEAERFNTDKLELHIAERDKSRYDMFRTSIS